MDVLKSSDPPPTTSSGCEERPVGAKKEEHDITQEPTTHNKSAKMSKHDPFSVVVQDISITDEIDISASTSDNTIDSDFEILVADIDELYLEMAAEDFELSSITTGDETSREESDLSIISTGDEELELSGMTTEDKTSKEEMEEIDSSGVTIGDETAKEESDLSVITTGDDSINISFPDSIKQEELGEFEKKNVTKVRNRSKDSWPLLKMQHYIPERFSPPPKDVRKKNDGQRKNLNRRYGICIIHNYRMDLFMKFLEDEANVTSMNAEAQSEAGVQHDKAVAGKPLYKITIWDNNFMDIDRATKLRAAILEKARRHFRMCIGPEMRFECKEDCLNVTCDDAYTLKWMRSTIRRLDLWEDIELEYKEQAPKEYLPAILHAKLSQANTPAEAMALLQSQNPDLNVLEWRKYHVFSKPYMNYIYFVIPESSLTELEKSRHWVDFGDTRTYVQVNLEYLATKLHKKPFNKPRIKGTIGTGYF